MVIGAGGSAVTGAEGAPACRLAHRSGDGSLSDKPWGWRSGRVGTRVEIVVEKRPEVIRWR
jgi:hypothetical protein